MSSSSIMVDLSVTEIADIDGNRIKAVPFKGMFFPPFDTSTIAKLDAIEILDDDTLLCSYPKSDIDGNRIKAVPFKGMFFPPFDTSTIAKLDAIEIRDDDSLLCSYPKSGTNWLWEICRLLTAGNLDQNDNMKEVTFMEYKQEELYKNIPSPRMLTTHAHFRYLPEDVLQKKIKIIQILRNPKDVAVSFYHIALKTDGYTGTFESFVKSSFGGMLHYGSWFDYVKSWEDVKKEHPELPLLTLLYEDLKEDSFREAKKVMKFLGLKRSDRFVQQVCDQCQFKSMKNIKAITSNNLRFFRKGQVGDWKNMFTVSLNEWFDKEYKEQMVNYPVRIRFTLD